MTISIVAAMSENRVIGINNKMPWHIPEDFQYFKQITTDKPVIMGRKTWDSLPKKPLPKRKNIVISRDKGYNVNGAVACTSLNDAILEAKKSDVDEIFIIGGAQIYEQALSLDIIDRVYLTYIYSKFEGDSFFPYHLLKNFKKSFGKKQGNKVQYSFDIYER